MKHPFTREQIDSLCVQDMCAYTRALLLLDGEKPEEEWLYTPPSEIERYVSPSGIASEIIVCLENGDGKSVWADHYRIPYNCPEGFKDKLETATRHILTTNTFPGWLYPVQEVVQEGLTWEQACEVVCKVSGKTLKELEDMHPTEQQANGWMVTDAEGRLFYPLSFSPSGGLAPYRVVIDRAADYQGEAPNTVNEPVKYDTWDDVLDELRRRGLTGSMSLRAPGADYSPQCVLDVDGWAFYPTLETFGDAPYTIDEEALAVYLDPFADIRKMKYVVRVSETELVTQVPGFFKCRATYEGVVQVSNGWVGEELKALNAWLAIVTKKEVKA
jgi:hypothetical protein